MKTPSENTPDNVPKVTFLSSHPYVASGDVLVSYDTDCPGCKMQTRWGADVTGSWCHECGLFVSRDIITDAPIIPSEDSPKGGSNPPPNCPVCGCRPAIEWADGGPGQWPSCGWYAPHPHCAVDAGSSQSEPVTGVPEIPPEDRPKDGPDQATEMDWSLPLPSCPACQIKTEWSYGSYVQCPACGWYTIHAYHATAGHRAGVAGSSQSEPVTGVAGSAPDDATIRHAVETADEALQEARQQILETVDIDQVVLVALSVRDHTEEELAALTDWVIETHLRSLMLGLVRKGLATMEWKGDEPMFRKKIEPDFYMKDTPENPPEDPGETPPTTESRARYEGAARFCPSCNMRTLFLVGDTGSCCTTCGHLVPREKHDQMERPQSAEIREKILAVVDQKHGAFWGEFYDALIPAHSVEEVRLALNSLVQDGTLRMKEDDSEHDWEYRRVAASCVQPDPPANQP